MRNEISIFIIDFLVINEFLDGLVIREDPFRIFAIIPVVTIKTKGDKVVVMRRIQVVEE